MKIVLERISVMTIKGIIVLAAEVTKNDLHKLWASNKRQGL